MPDNFSLNELFKAGFSREQFKTEIASGKYNADLSRIYSLFGEDIEAVAETIFDAADSTKDGTIDDDELLAIKSKFKDENDEVVSENDVISLAMESSIKRYGTLKPSQMYKNVMSKAGDPRDSEYVLTLDNQINELEQLILKRNTSSMQKIDGYQEQINTLITDLAKNKRISSSKYSEFSAKEGTLQKDLSEKNIEVDLKERELKQAQKDKEALEAELRELQKDPEAKRVEIEGLQYDINIKNEVISTLSSEIASLHDSVKSVKSGLSTVSKNRESFEADILSGNSAIKDKIKELRANIKAEELSAKADIDNYKSELDILTKARAYAITQIQKNIAEAESNPVDVNYVNTGANCPGLKDVNYSAEKGQKLAEYMRRHSVGFIGRCSHYVSNGIAATGLGHERMPSAHMMDSELRKNPNYKEINVSSQEELRSLPAGCIIVYEAGAARYNSTHGHIEVTLGNGTNCSDGITRNPRYAPPGQMHVFVPVG